MLALQLHLGTGLDVRRPLASAYASIRRAGIRALLLLPCWACRGSSLRLIGTDPAVALAPPIGAANGEVRELRAAQERDRVASMPRAAVWRRRASEPLSRILSTR